MSYTKEIVPPRPWKVRKVTINLTSSQDNRVNHNLITVFPIADQSWVFVFNATTTEVLQVVLIVLPGVLLEGLGVLTKRRVICTILMAQAWWVQQHMQELGNVQNGKLSQPEARRWLTCSWAQEGRELLVQAKMVVLDKHLSDFGNIPYCMWYRHNEVWAQLRHWRV